MQPGDLIQWALDEDQLLRERSCKRSGKFCVVLDDYLYSTVSRCRVPIGETALLLDFEREYCSIDFVGDTFDCSTYTWLSDKGVYSAKITDVIAGTHLVPSVVVLKSFNSVK